MRRYIKDKVLLRCYGYEIDGRWCGVCVDLNLAAEANSSTELKEKINDVINSYIETVLDTEDKESIPELLSRSAPLKDWVIYYLIKIACITKNIRGKITFKETIPFHLAHSC